MRPFDLDCKDIKDYFTLIFKTLEIEESSNPIGEVIKFDPKGLILKVKTKICQMT